MHSVCGVHVWVICCLIVQLLPVLHHNDHYIYWVIREFPWTDEDRCNLSPPLNLLLLPLKCCLSVTSLVLIYTWPMARSPPVAMDLSPYSKLVRPSYLLLLIVREWSTNVCTTYNLQADCYNASSDARILDLPMQYRISPSMASPGRIRPTRRAGLWRVQGMYSLLVSAIIFRQVAI